MSDSEFQDLTSLIPNPKLKRQNEQMKEQIKDLNKQRIKFKKQSQEKIELLATKLQQYLIELQAKNHIITRITNDNIKISKKLITMDEFITANQEEMLASDLVYEKSLESHLSQKDQLIQVNQQLTLRIIQLEKLLSDSHETYQKQSADSKQLQKSLVTNKQELYKRTKQNEEINRQNRQLNQKVKNIERQLMQTRSELNQEKSQKQQLIGDAEGNNTYANNDELQQQIQTLKSSLIQFTQHTQTIHKEYLQKQAEYMADLQSLQSQLKQKENQIIAMHLTAQRLSFQLNKSKQLHLSQNQKLIEMNQSLVIKNLEQIRDKQIDFHLQRNQYESRLKQQTFQKQQQQLKVTEYREKLLQKQRQNAEITQKIEKILAQNASLTKVSSKQNQRLRQLTYLQAQLKKQLEDSQLKIQDYQEVFNQLKQKKIFKNNSDYNTQTDLIFPLQSQAKSELSHHNPSQKVSDNQVKPSLASESEDVFRRENIFLHQTNQLLKNQLAKKDKQLRELEECIHVYSNDNDLTRKQCFQLKQKLTVFQIRNTELEKQLIQIKENNTILEKQYVDEINRLTKSRGVGNINQIYDKESEKVNKLQENEQDLMTIILIKIKQFNQQISINIHSLQLSKEQENQFLKQQKQQLLNRIEKAMGIYKQKKLRAN